MPARRRDITPTAPRLPADELAVAAPAGLAHDRLEGVRVEGADLGGGVRASGVTLEGVVLSDVALTGAQLDALTAVDIEIRGGNLANVRALRSSWSRVLVDRCRLTGATLADSALRDVTFRNCRLDLATFAHSRVERVVFEGCVLEEAELGEARLDGVRFERCGLAGADLRAARLRDVELRACDLGGLVGAETLRGASMPWEDVVANAGLWAAALGIAVLE